MTFCSNCGTRFPEGARFCENCGSAVPAQQHPEPASSTGQITSEQLIAAGSAQAGSDEPKRKGRRVLTAVGGVAAVGVLAGVGYVVYDQFSGPNGGAASPTAAVLELSAAADGEDAATALSLLAPGEVGSVADVYRDVQAKAIRDGIAKAGDPFAGFDLALDGVEVQTEELGDDVAAVTVTSGTVSWALDPDLLPGPLRIDSNGDVREAASGSADLVDVTREATDAEPLRIMTVQRDGKWYVSPVTTLLEAWRAEEGLPAPDFSRPLDLAGTGADSATAAVEQAARSVAAYDVDGFLDLVSPEEGAALYQYRDAIVTMLHRDGDLAELQSSGRLSVDDVDATEGDEVDGRVPVTVRSASGSLAADGEYYTWDLDRNCVSYSGDDDSDGGCLDTALADLGLGDDVASRFPALRLLTEEVDGRWYISPLATLAADARDVVAGMDADDVASLLQVPQFGGVDGQLTEGRSVNGSWADHDQQLYEMDVPAGKVLSACVQGGDAYLYRPDGRPVGGATVLADEGGTYRALVYPWEDSATYEVRTRLSDVTDLTVPATVPPAEGGCGGRVLRFPATAGKPLLLSADNGYLGSITSPSGETRYASSGFVPSETGEYTLVVQAEAETTISALPADVLVPGQTVTGSASGSSGTTLKVFAPAESDVTIDVRGVDGFAPNVSLYDADGTLVDQGRGYLSPASVSPYAYVSGLYTVVVRDSYGDPGTFQLSVVESGVAVDKD
jgi:hypothetical protein